ncbi:aminotransferase class V-fold PLP-dependent enzyme [Dendrosporobacter sp. 1207_IL3150]|uniref:aminotransferase class V-fold PLP-dependent enzyme n=1 Tax=Dendrosporobacter sp. 1207_IL3150 TaxID=3084054 RepID=UPI002FD95F45
MIYVDNAATTWPKPDCVYKAVDECLRSVAGNPGRGGHGASRQATHILYEAREELAGLFGFKNPTQLVFTQNATEALNLALLGTISPGDRVLTTSMEHNAVARPLRYLETKGVEVLILEADCEGKINLNRMEEILQSGVKTLVLSHSSNVNGAIVPLHAIGALTKKYQTTLIVDVAQTAGIEYVNVAEMNISMLAFSGHKGLFGPQGTGGLYIKEDILINPLRYGGTGSLSESDLQPEFLPDRLESGTANTPGIAGLLAGVRFIKSIGQNVIKQKEAELTNILIKGLSQIENVKVYGPTSEQNRTAVVSCLIGSNDSGAIAYRMDRDYGIACRGGLHCAPWAHNTIGTINTGTIRFSPGFFNSTEDIAQVLEAVRSLAGEERGA